MSTLLLPKYLPTIDRDTAYYVGRYNGDQTIYAYEEITPSDLQDIPISLRFSGISKLQDSILKRDKAPINDPYQPVDESKFRDEIRLMTMLAQSIRHTDAYCDFMNACSEYLFTRLLEAKKFIKFIKTWDEIALSDQKHTVRLREKYHNVAAGKTSRSSIANTDVKFMDDPSVDPSVASRPCRVYGFSYGTIGGGKDQRKIEVSAHPLGPLTTADKAMKTGHHEKVHDIGLQQGGLYVREDYYALGDLHEDAELWVHLKQQRAIISNRIKRPYREQFHEVLAFEQGDKMQRFIREEILGLPTSTPPAPS